ncbi:MAG: hypothetical protein ACR2HG_07175 [Pyrinomonadaceae bacterium]
MRKKVIITAFALLGFFVAISSCVNNIYAQDAPSNTEAQMGGIDNYDVSQTNIVYNFNELPLYSIYGQIQYQYARFTPYPYGNLQVYNQVNPYSYYPNFIVNPYPIFGFGGIDVQFFQPVRNLTFSTIGVDGGYYKVDIYQNGSFTQQITVNAYCGLYINCFTNLSGYQNLTRITINSINDPAGLGFDDFSFTLGGTPTPTPTPTPQNHAPIGYLDSVQDNGIADGWTLDSDNQDVSNPVHFYIDGLNSANFVGAIVASIPRPDVNQITGYRGNHGFQFSIPSRFMDGVNHTIYAYGIDLTSGQPATLLTGSPKTFNIKPPVQSVVFEPITNETINNELTNSEIDRSIYGYPSQRIFAEKKFPEDTVNHKRVRVKATVGKPNVAVYFQNYDVDDPSDDDIIDDNGSAGNDNREGRIIGQPYPPSAAGTLSDGSTVCPPSNGMLCRLTDSNGVATITFSVTKQPGDNFRVAASTDPAYLSGVTVNGTGLKDSANISLPTMKAQQTDMLMVWRKVHLEVDSMGPVAFNIVNGRIQSKSIVGQDPIWIYLSNTIGNLDVGRFRATCSQNEDIPTC